MSYFDYTKQFWRSGAARELSTGAIALYWCILDRFNLARWPDRLRITYKEIQAAIGISINSIKAARQELKQAGFIDFRLEPNPRLNTEYELRLNRTTEASKSDSRIQSNPDSRIQSESDRMIPSKPDNPPTPPYICRQDNITSKTLSQDTHAQARTRRSNENDNPEDFDIDNLLPRFFCPGNEEMLRLYASHNGIPYGRLRVLAEEVMVEMKLADRRFYSYSEAARALQNIMRAKHTHLTNQPKSQSNDDNSDPDDFGPDPFAFLPSERH